ncbi:MAG: hypothetical protein V4725_06805 [Bacteroidota bacterium]
MKAKTNHLSSRSKAAETITEEPGLINIEQLIRQAKEDAAWKTAKLYSRTLLKDAGLRMMLIGIHEASTIEMHEAEATICIQVLEGSLLYSAGEKTLLVNEGELLTIDKGVVHGLSAKIPTLFLMTKAV